MMDEKIRKLITVVFVSAGFMFLPAVYLHAASIGSSNDIGNNSFEQPLGSGGADSGNWDNTNNAVRVDDGTDAALGDSPFLPLPDGRYGTSIPAGAFTFQVVDGAQVGDFVAFSGYAASNIAAPNGGRMKIEFKEVLPGGSDQLISVVQSSCINSGNAATFTNFAISGRAPKDTGRIVFTLDRCGGVGDVVFDKMTGTINGQPIDLGVGISKNRLSKGSAAFATINLQNLTVDAQTNVQLVLNVPNGLNVVDDGTRLNNEIPTFEGRETRYFPIGTINAQDNKTLAFLVVVSPGAVIGHRYTMTLYARDATNAPDEMKRDVLSQTRSIPITVIGDPLFDEGTILGKVFDDRNENGVQDAGEKGISSVRLATEEGIVIKTDQDGKYHIPGVQPGRHVVKIDGHTLPAGTKFVTEEAYLVKMTDGLLSKVDFAVKLPDSKVSDEFRNDLDVVVSEGTDFTKPKLEVRMDPDILRIGEGMLERAPVFLIDTNYGSMIGSWRVDVRDEMGREIWSGYGLGPPPAQAPWSGVSKSRKVIPPGNYSYRLIVRDAKGHEDWTSLRFFKAVSKRDSGSDHAQVEESGTGFANIQREGKRSIPMVAKPTLLVRGKARPDSTVEVNGRAIQSKPDGSFETEFFTEPGERPVHVRAMTEDGKSVSYHDNVEVKDTSFFMVALGEEEIGSNMFNGNLETVGRDKQYHEGFYQKGKAAYYLKGKIKGKFLVSSRYDTTSPLRQELFTNLDPDLYYPVYGDQSDINYEARDTQERLYLLIEMDRSYLKYGDYKTNFNDTELATYDRALSGVKVHHEVLSTNRYGDSLRGFTVFAAKAKSLADHNEFLGTGGSLYYLRNKNVVEGSEQVRVEIRDKLQGITISRKDLAAKTDYEIDYRQGRVLLRKPLSSVGYSDSILSNDLLNGNDVFLIVDYEFEAQDLFGDQPAGVRGYTYLGDHLRVGGTAFREKRQDRDYDLRGVDTLLKLGNNTKVAAEYAQSKDPQTRNAVSYNGGITFKSLTAGDKVIEKETRLFDGAWLVKGESQPRKGTEISGYAQRFNKGFSSADSISQKNEIKGGLAVRQKIGQYAEASYRYDQARDMEAYSKPDRESHSAQLKYDDNKYLAVGEYRTDNFDVTNQTYLGLLPVFDRTELKQGVGAKFGYHMDNSWTPYVRGQWTGKGAPNHQVGGGLEANLLNQGTVRVEEMVGTLGEATLIGFDRRVDERTNVYGEIQTGATSSNYGRGVSTTIGSSYQVNEKGRVRTEREVSSFERGEKSGDLAGYDVSLSDQWNLGISGERSRIRDLKDEAEINEHPDVRSDYYHVERSAGSVELSYLDRDVIKWINKLELRLDRGDVRRHQWLASHSLEWKLTPDYHFLARVNKSMTVTRSDDNLDGDFMEFNVGLAYRPVRHNRFNLLTRYTWLRDVGGVGQLDSPDYNGLEVNEQSHIMGIEGVYDVCRWFGVSQKLGYKMGLIRSGASSDWIDLGTFLTVSRINIHVTRKWDIAAEYRIRFDHQVLDAVTGGFLFEVDRELYEYIRFGIGYNFTDFSDDLRQSNAYSNHGFFTRLSGKF